MIENAKNEPSSLESECPHIIRVFKHIFQNVHSRSRPLAHHERGLTIKYINSITNDKQYSTMIANAATFLENMGWTLYPSHNIGKSSFESMHIDIVNLLDLDVDLQQIVVKKIDFFGQVGSQGTRRYDQTHKTSRSCRHVVFPFRRRYKENYIG